jgi:hypothetical protein
MMGANIWVMCRGTVAHAVDTMMHRNERSGWARDCSED